MLTRPTTIRSSESNNATLHQTQGDSQWRYVASELLVEFIVSRHAEFRIGSPERIERRPDQARPK